MSDDRDDLDGCDVALSGPGDMTTSDADIDALVLFADVQFDDPSEVDERVRQYEGLFGGA